MTFLHVQQPGFGLNMIKKIFYIFILLFGILAFCIKPYAQSWFTVKWVDDGDTIVLTDDRHIRYIGINAPEIDHKDQKAEPYGYESKLYNKQVVLKKKVRLQFDKEKYDRYGRVLAYVFMPGGEFVNKEMVEKGYAYVLPRRPNTKYERILLKAQHNAMVAGKGMWKNWKQKPGKYWGSRKSKRFHYPTCRFAKRIAKKNRIVFSSMWDGFWAGYAPGKQCVLGGKVKP